MNQSKGLEVWLITAILALPSFCYAILAQTTDVGVRQKAPEQALRLGLKGEYEQALAALRPLQEAAEKNDDKAGLAMAIIDSAVIYFLQGQYFKALGAYQKLPPLTQIEHDRSALAHVLSRRAFLGYYRNAYEQALKDAEQSLSLFDPAADKVDRGFTLNVLGLIQEALKADAKSLVSFQESLRVYGELGDEFWLAFPLNNLGYYYHRQDNDALALKSYQQALSLIERYSINTLLPYTLNNIGDAHFYLGDYPQALSYFQRSLAAREAKGQKDEISTALRDIGSAYRSQGEYARAIEHFQKSLVIEQSVGNKARIGSRLRNIGEVYAQQNNFDLALDYYQKSLRFAEEAKDAEGVAAGLMAIGTIYLMFNNVDMALEYFQRSLSASRTLSHKTLAAAPLLFIGDAYRRKGEYEQALAYFQKCLDVYEGTPTRIIQAEFFLNIGHTYRLQGEYQKALDAYGKALEVSIQTTNNKLIERQVIALSADAYCAQGDYERALRFAEQAYDLTNKLWNPDVLASARAVAARAHRALGRAEKARQCYDEAIALIEQERAQFNIGAQNRQRLFEQRVRPYYEMIDLLVEQKRFDEALIYAERAKGRVLLDALKSGRVDITKSLTAAEQTRERSLTSELTSLNAQLLRERQSTKPDERREADLEARLAQARRDYEDFENQLYAVHPELRLKRGEARILNLEQAAALLTDAQTALLQFVVTDDGAYLFVITRGAASFKTGKTGKTGKTDANLQAYPLAIKRKELATKIESFRRAIEERDLEFVATARQLYNLLLAPASAQLRGKTNLIIVPDDALWGLPFQALQPAPNRYLIEDAALSYAPSLSVLYEIEKLRGTARPAGAATLLAFGNPALDEQTAVRARSVLRAGARLDPLPESEQEAKALAQIYGAGNARVYTGAEAREARAKEEAGQFTVIHFATHGVFNDASPMYSHLALTPGRTQSGLDEDGLLEAWEILKLDLKADLVVLSACETGRGRIGAGEGLIGLSWAMFVAGSPTTVVSQWKVASGATRQLMIEFHRRLRAPQTQITKAAALRAAALQMLRSSGHRHPFYWAGFIVIGANR